MLCGFFFIAGQALNISVLRTLQSVYESCSLRDTIISPTLNASLTSPYTRIPTEDFICLFLSLRPRKSIQLNISCCDHTIRSSLLWKGSSLLTLPHRFYCKQNITISYTCQCIKALICKYFYLYTQVRMKHRPGTVFNLLALNISHFLIKAM